MQGRPKIAVKDANVLIDLEVAGLLDLWFQLEIETHTTVFVQNELDGEKHPELITHFQAGNIISHDLEFAEIVVVDALLEEVNRSAKFNDCSVLYLAEKLGAALLTGDGALRKSALSRGVQVYGTLWIFDQLVGIGALKPATAAAKLATLLSDGTFLPREECERRLTLWTSD